MNKSTTEEIRQRFDNDVERFSNLETGQSATVNAPLVLDLISEAAAATTPSARAILDVGCGAGNYTLKLLQQFRMQGAPPAIDVTLVDLSRPMLDRAVERVETATSGRVIPLQGDIRQLPLGENQFDIILAAAVLHHLREDAEWEAVFAAFYRSLRPGGSLWISDLVAHTNPALHATMWRRYGEYLAALKGGSAEGERYRDHVFAYVEREDTPRPLTYQLDLLRRCGFKNIDVVHNNSCFAAFAAMRVEA